MHIFINNKLLSRITRVDKNKYFNIEEHRPIKYNILIKSKEYLCICF